MKLKPTHLLWLPPTGRKYHRVGKSAQNLYYSYCGRMLPRWPDIEIDMIWPYVGEEMLCKRCRASFDRT